MTQVIRTELGRISQVEVGLGGYDDAMLGLTIILAGKGWGVHAPFIGAWCPGLIKARKGNEWTEEDRTQQLADAMREIGRLLLVTKKTEVHQLVGTPVEVTFEENAIKSWRVLSEVLA